MPGCFIQFDASYVASDFSISFDVNNTNTFKFDIDFKDNKDVVWYRINMQNPFSIIYRIKIVITKALYIENLKYQDSGYNDHEKEYNPNKLVGICNIGMIDADFAGRAFLGECGGRLYGDVTLYKDSTIKNVPVPLEEGDASNKGYVDTSIGDVETSLETVITKYGLDLDTIQLLDDIIDEQNGILEVTE